ncbi:MAG: type 4a pilus biogenesis protein PilO [Syntrophomonadaceae bacterium]|nr:type 4a pilus biogenesis protein PilO [Syntrophomonadaceae bacterium]
MSLSTRERALLGLFFVLGCVFLLDQYLFKPLDQEARQLIAENNRLHEELQDIEERITRYQAMEKSESQPQAYYQELLEAIPQSPLIPDIIDFLETKARGNKIKLSSIHYKENKTRPSDSKPAGPGLQPASLEPVNFQIVAGGSYYNLLSFVLALENAPRIYVINSLKISLAVPERYPQGIAAANSGASSEAGAQSATPELLFYDQGQSILNLDFNAYYHNLLTDGTAQP